MLNNHGSKHDRARNGRHLTILGRLKMCFHHNLRELCVHTDGAWWKLKKYCTSGDISKYPDG